MKRRTLISATAHLTGAAVSAPLIAALSHWNPAVAAEHSSEGIPVFFSPEDFECIRMLVDTMLPATDSPAASEVGVPMVIDEMVALIYRPEEKINYEVGHQALMAFLNTRGYGQEEPDNQLALLRELMSSERPEDQAARSGLLTLKQQAIAVYLSSEDIAENWLNYLPIPGDYEPCIPVAEVGNKAWAL